MEYIQPDFASSGIEELDGILGGGFERQRLHLVMGGAGTGKTTLAMQFALAGRERDEKVLYVTLTESASELESIARSHGWTLEGIDVFELMAPVDEGDPEMPQSLFNPSEVELTEAFRRLRERVKGLSPEILILDSVSELKMMAQDRFYYRRYLAAFKTFCSEQKVTVLKTAEPQTGHEDTQSYVHSVINLEQKASSYGNARRRLLVTKVRGTHYRTGYHDFAIRTGGIAVFPRLNVLEDGGKKRMALISSGLSRLDELLGDGIHSSTSMLIAGPAGIGKSTMAMSFAAAAAERDEPALICLFDESVETMRMRSGILGGKFDSHVESGRIILRKIDPSSTTMGQFSSMIKEEIETSGVKMVVIDTLNALLQSMSETQMLEMHVNHLIDFLSGEGVTSILVMAEHGIGSTASETVVNISYLADTVMIMRYFESGGEILNAVSVLKKRTGRHERTIRQIRFTGGGIEIGEPLAEFQGVLTGNPRYVGRADKMLGREADDGR